MISFGNAASSHRYKFASKRTLDYFPKKYPEYANNWLVVTDSSESRNGERHSSSCRMQYVIISYSGYNITEPRTKSCSDVIMYHWSLYSVISISRRFNRGPFWCKFYLFAKCARVYETWKQCQWIMRTFSCKHKIWGGAEIGYIWGPI